jgi:aspartokinase
MPASDPAAWVVHKFGGSSVADAECFKRVANILETLPPGRLGVVLSACRGVTDALLGLVARAEAQDDAYRGDLDVLRARHATIAGSARIAAQASSSEGLSTVALMSPTMSSSRLIRKRMASSRASFDGYIASPSTVAGLLVAARELCL